MKFNAICLVNGYINDQISFKSDYNPINIITLKMPDIYTRYFRLSVTPIEVKVRRVLFTDKDIND